MSRLRARRARYGVELHCSCIEWQVTDRADGMAWLLPTWRDALAFVRDMYALEPTC